MSEQEQQRQPGTDELAEKLQQYFAGKIVRKDLTKKIKEGANVPVYVLEYLLGMYCASRDETEIEAGVRNVKQILIKYSDEDSALVSNIQTALDNVITEQNNAANVMAKLGVANMDELANQVTVTLKPATETPTATVEVAPALAEVSVGVSPPFSCMLV